MNLSGRRSRQPGATGERGDRAILSAGFVVGAKSRSDLNRADDLARPIEDGLLQGSLPAGQGAPHLSRSVTRCLPRGSCELAGRYDRQTGESLRSNGDNILSLSTGGKRWSKPRVLGTPQDEVFGAVAIRDGMVAVSSYTRHYAGNGSVDLDYAFWSTTKGHGSGRFDLRRVTTQSSDPQVQFVGADDEGNEVQGLFIGDYTALALGSDGVLHPDWTDFRGNPGTTTPNQDAYTQAFRTD
jgi:hypothetical protein